MNFNQLRQQHKRFIYQDYTVSQVGSDLKIVFNFLLSPDIEFHPETIFPTAKWNPKLENLTFNLGLIEMISYWKATCSPEIVIEAGKLNQEQIKWWKDLLQKGLGEFFYQNQIDFSKQDLVKFTTTANSHIERGLIVQGSGNVFTKELKNRSLILVGGGKDSAVTVNNFSGKENNCLLLNPTEAARKITRAAGFRQPIVIKRIIEPKLLDLNKQGYLNGHTPFSAYLAFLSTLAAHLYNYKNIVVSNESSASEGNVKFHEQIINHQYSKSLEFEEKFRDYSRKYLSSSSYYYSALRNFNELEITRQFSLIPKYHRIFRSCNRGSLMGGVWCNNCSKCLFAYLMLYPFLGDRTSEIFGKDLLNDETLIPIMEELLQVPGKFKPFECVGTKEEVKYAMLLSILKLKGKKLPKLLEKYRNLISILILGAGREGQSTLNFLKRYVNQKQIKISDKKDNKNYLDNLIDFDVIFRSPGIPYLPEIIGAKKQGKIITSATQIFFDLCPAKIIGVTGTKGKSTTAALIYEVLKKGGFDAYLVGNIGQPALEVINQVGKNSLMVFELSSFQLNDLTSSPSIAVITNVYPEHLDWHGNFENYQKSKQNIYRFQKKGDSLISGKSGADAARMVGKMFKISKAKINQAIADFRPLPHRLELVTEKNGIKFYNDSLATNPHATIFGLNKLGNDVQTLITGGFDRGIDYSVIGPVIAKSKIKILILFPVTGSKIEKAVKVANGIQQIFKANSMAEAVKLAFENTSSGKICLLSPASASFNMFKDYEDRGDQFKEAVLSYNRGRSYQYHRLP